MTHFLEELQRAAAASVEPEPAQPGTPWDQVLATFVAFLNTTYADALRASCRYGAAPGVVRLVVSPRGQRNHQTPILVLHFTAHTAFVLAERSDEIPSVEALQARLAHMVRSTAFRNTVDFMRKMSQQPVPGVLHAGGIRDRQPSTDVLVTLSATEQIKLADASEADQTDPITLHATLAGASPAGRGTYAPEAMLRWLVAGGYGLALDMQHGHALEGEGMVRLSGKIVNPDYVQSDG